VAEAERLLTEGWRSWLAREVAAGPGYPAEGHRDEHLDHHSTRGLVVEAGAAQPVRRTAARASMDVQSVLGHRVHAQLQDVEHGLRASEVAAYRQRALHLQGVLAR